MAKQIALFALAVEGAGWLVLTIKFSRDMPFHRALWHGLFHAVSAFCNAGLDLQGNFQSLVGYCDSLVVNVAVAVLAVAGALSFLVVREIFDFLYGLKKSVRRDSMGLDARLVITGYVVIVAIGFLAMLILEWNGMLAGGSGPNRVLAAGFQAIAGRTSGFSTVN